MIALPFRVTILQQCWLLLELGNYYSVLMMSETDLSHAKQVCDASNTSEANVVLNVVSKLSGYRQKAVDSLLLKYSIRIHDVYASKMSYIKMV